MRCAPLARTDWGFRELILIHWRPRQDPVGRGAGDCATKVLSGMSMPSSDEVLLLLALVCNMSGNAFPEAQGAIVRPLRVESPVCWWQGYRVTGRSLAGGYCGAALACPSWRTSVARRLQAKQVLQERQALAAVWYGWEKGRAASSSCSGQQRGNETIDHEENVSLSGGRGLHGSGWEAPRPSGLSSWIVNHRPCLASG